MGLLTELVYGLCTVLIYFVIAASSAVILRRCVSIPNEVFRKLLHGILLGSLFIWTVRFETWWLAAASALGFAVVVYPLLKLLELIPGFSAFMTERRRGELKQSLLIVFAMYAVVVTVCWGLCGDRLLSLCSIYAWGFGDAAAALVGKRFGRHKLSGKHIEGIKSVEGTAAMFLVSFLSVLLLLLYRGGLAWYIYPLAASVTAAVSAAVELYSVKGSDTITCPLAAMMVLLLLLRLFGGEMA